MTDRSKAILLWWFFLFYVLVFNFFVLLAPYVCFHIFSSVKITEWPLIGKTEWPLIGKIAAHSLYDMFHGICT